MKIIVDLVELKGFCVSCGRSHSVYADRKSVMLWQSGELIQNAMPEVSAEDREFLISRICPKCWDDMFGIGEDEDEDWEDCDYEENMPCDNCGFCVGTTCPKYYECRNK